MTYDEARPWARSIKQRVTQREMPPWYVERNIISENRAGSGFALGNQPPTIELVGARERTVAFGDPLRLIVRVSDDGIPETRAVSGPRDPRVVVDASGRPIFGAGRFGRRNAMGLRAAWLQWRGPGKVTFDPWYMEGIDDHMPGWSPPPLPPDGTVVTTASFSMPGTYVLRAMADDGYLSTPVDVTAVIDPLRQGPMSRRREVCGRCGRECSTAETSCSRRH